MKCDACGAPVENGKCTYCGKTFATESTQQQAAPAQPTTIVNNVYTTAAPVKEKKKVTFGKVLLWIFFLPIMATIAIWKSQWKLWLKILVTALIWIWCIVYAGSSDSSTTSTSTSSSSSTVSSTVEETKNYTIGDTIDYKGIKVTLRNVYFSNGDGNFVKPDDGKKYIGLIFDIDNSSSGDIAVSSLLCFEAYCDDYAVDYDLVGLQAPEWDGYGQLDGSVAAGKRMMGVITYQVPTDFTEFEIRYTPSFWSGKDVIYTFTADQVN